LIIGGASLALIDRLIASISTSAVPSAHAKHGRDAMAMLFGNPERVLADHQIPTH